jgi:Fe2+ or Zn2+ uptake regulation protein
MMKNKWSQLKTIIENLREPKQIGEIVTLLRKTSKKITKRTVYNYLNELVALGLIEHDENARTYQRVGVKKKQYASKAEYEIDVKHAKHLILSNEKKNTQRFDQTSLYNVVDLLAFHNNKRHLDSELDECVFQHINTGYNKELYQHLQKYRQLMDENGLSDPTTNWLDYRREGEVKNENEVPEKVLQEIDALKGMLAGIIDRNIISPVQEGQPLLGECNQCPHLKFSVKD